MRLRLKVVVVCTAVAVVVVAMVKRNHVRDENVPSAADRAIDQAVGQADDGRPPRGFRFDNDLTLWWERIPESVRSNSRQSGVDSNIHPDDYIGPQACRQCHKKNYESWSAHPHRWMNALADPSTVRGDFSAEAGIDYLGGRAEFIQQDDRFEMRLSRNGIRRVYRVTQTIGSRFYQYYVGRQTAGPDRYGRPSYHTDHVLPFGYWLESAEWVPIVHVRPEGPDGTRIDPFDPDLVPDHIQHPLPYVKSCNYCHTTYALGDMFLRNPILIGDHVPASLDWAAIDYLSDARPELLSGNADAITSANMEVLESVWESMLDLDARSHAITLGISCEACHLGAKAHAEGRLKRPSFAPRSPHLWIRPNDHPVGMGTRSAGVNWACGRCHAGKRPQFAASMSTWNSTEYSDAMRGSCYSELTCITCHNPHQATGPQWSRPPAEDDALCLKCHQKYRDDDSRAAHSHHPIGSSGSRCMNCHMPKINEGLQDVVRTHMIYSPNLTEMIEANHPNACNLCHTDKSIDWTLVQLKDWYGSTYDGRKISHSYPDRQSPVGTGWLKSDDEAVRLVAAWTLARNNDRWALPDLIDVLDDPFMINRQFAGRMIQKMLGIKLSDFGYRFYMTPAERSKPLQEIRQSVPEAETGAVKNHESSE